MLKSIQFKNRNLLSYAEYGDKNGYPILIQHGMIASITGYKIFEPLVALGARLVCIARPGYGDSSPYEMSSMVEWAEIVSVLVDKLGLPRFDVLGMSSGAPYSYAIGYRFPDQVRNIFIFSGIPALYDEKVASHWPYPVNKDASMEEMQALAARLFFSNLSEEDLKNKDISDSMSNHCFGPAQDLILRSKDWGFRLEDINVKVHMQHSRFDDNVPCVTAELTSQLLPNCSFAIKETDVHFSVDLLHDFFKTVVAAQF